MPLSSAERVLRVRSDEMARHEPKQEMLSTRGALSMLSPSSIVLAAAVMILPAALPAQQTITGQAAFADWNQQHPGVRREISLADLPKPDPEEAVNTTPHVVPRPANAWPIAPAGFKVTLYAGGDSAPMQRADNKQVMALSGGTFTMPRLIRTAPNGDLFP